MEAARGPPASRCFLDWAAKSGAAKKIYFASLFLARTGAMMGRFL